MRALTAKDLEDLRFNDARGHSLLLALSGGADSVALLLLLLERREADGFSLTAAHFHHGIRGKQADDDAEFVRALCSRLGVQLFEGYGDVPALARARSIGLEVAAREVRYAFLREAKTQCGADWIALAHHRDDQAETVLMHLLRGAGPDGACGMARLDGDLYRPLLDVPKAALRKYLESRGVCWREDATNAIPDNPRNALRLNVMPLIEKSYPAAAAALARYARLARIERDLVAKLADDFLRERLEHGPWGRRLRLDGSEEEALLRRALRALCSALNASQTDALVALAQSPRGAMQLPGALRAERTPHWLYLLDHRPAPREEVPLPTPDLIREEETFSASDQELTIGSELQPKPGDPRFESSDEVFPTREIELSDVARLKLEWGHFPVEANDPRTELFDPAALHGAVLRLRISGDRFHPLGAPGDRLLSDYLTDKKIDRPLRDWLPLVAVGGRVLWVCGVGMSETARVRDFNRCVARLTLQTKPTVAPPGRGSDDILCSTTRTAPCQ